MNERLVKCQKKLSEDSTHVQRFQYFMQVLPAAFAFSAAQTLPQSEPVSHPAPTVITALAAKHRNKSLNSIPFNRVSVSRFSNANILCPARRPFQTPVPTVTNMPSVSVTGWDETEASIVPANSGFSGRSAESGRVEVRFRPAWHLASLRGMRHPRRRSPSCDPRHRSQANRKP